MVSNQIRNELDPLLPPRQKPVVKKHKDPLEYMATRVSAKIEDGDFKGAISLMTKLPQRMPLPLLNYNRNIHVYTPKL